MDRTQELEEQVRQLSQTVDEMRARMARIEGRDPSDGNGHQPSSRRGFLKLGAGAALGAVGMAAAKVLPAAAADGAPVVTGGSVTGEHTTTITDDSATGTAVPVLATKAFNYSSVDQTAAATFFGALEGLGGKSGTDPLTAVPLEGVDGWAEGVKAFGVYGLTDMGVGVTGESNTGIGLYARRSGRIQQDPRPLAGKPNYVPADFEMVRDLNGAMWISGPGGIWTQPSLNSFPNPRRILGTSFTSGVIYGPFDATLESDHLTPTGIPAGAKAAYCAVQSYKPGVLTLFPDLTPDTGIANYSGTGSLGTGLNLLYMLVPLSPAGKFKIHSYITGQCFVDAWGFLV